MISNEDSHTRSKARSLGNRIVGCGFGMLQRVPATMSYWYTLFPYHPPGGNHSRSNRPADMSRSMRVRSNPLRFAEDCFADNKRPFSFRSAANSTTSERICSSGTPKSFIRFAIISSVDLRSLINAQILAPTGLRLKQMPC